MQSLAELLEKVGSQKGSWMNVDLAQDIKDFLWFTYDPNDDLIYTTIDGWDDLLTETIETGFYSLLTKDEVLGILFGLIHRTRIIDGLWRSMFECGVAQELLAQLYLLDHDDDTRL